MGVYSIGVDLTEIDRIQKMIETQGDRFLKKVFTKNEIEYCRKKVSCAQNYAARFAAKEAVFKAIGTGLNLGINWQDVEVINNDLGCPFVRLYGKTEEMLKGKQVHLSLTHAGDMALAMVVID